MAFSDGYVVLFRHVVIGIFRWLLCCHIQVLFNGRFPFGNAHLLWFFYQFHFRCESWAVKTLEWSESTVGNTPSLIRSSDGTGFHPNGMDAFPRRKWPVQYIKGKPGGSWFGVLGHRINGSEWPILPLFCTSAAAAAAFFSTPAWLTTWFEPPPIFFFNFFFLSSSPSCHQLGTVLLWPFFMAENGSCGADSANCKIPSFSFLSFLACFLFYGGWKVHPIWFLLWPRLWWWWWWCQK